MGVLEPNEPGRVHGAHTDRQNAAEALLGQLVLVEYLHAQAMRRGRLLGYRGQVRGHHVGGGGVHQVTDERHRPGEDPGPAGRVLVGGVDDQFDVARGASGGVAQVVGDGVGADEKDIGVHPRQAADERTVTGSEVDVDGREAGGKLRQSSTIYPALLLAFDEVHGRRDYHFQINSTHSSVASR